jgi:vacuolar-type H+-ATPase subunit I/STV1
MSIVDQVQQVDFDRPRVVETISADFLRLRKRRVESLLEQLSFQQQTVQESEEPADQMRYLTQEAQQLSSQKRRLEAALAVRS